VNPQFEVGLIAAACSGVVGGSGVLLVRLGGGRSVRASLLAVAGVSLVAVVAGVVGTARAMFLSRHDFGVTLVVSAVAGLVGFGVALVLSARVMADVRILVRAATAIGPSGLIEDDELAAELPRPRMAELRRVRDELAGAAERLAESRNRERSLESSRRELVAWVSHDLRTPLAGLRAMAKALEDDVAEDPSRYHRQMRREVDRLARMVDDLFELSRIQSGALTLTLDRVEVGELVSDVLAGTRPVADARGVRLDATIDPALVDPALADADAAGLGRVLANLVVNAIRHTPSDGTVSVLAAADGQDVVLAVSDRCGGIGRNDLDRVFEAGWRGSAARSPQSDAESDAGVGAGAGLGLAIARGIVEAHRGRIQVVNTDGGCRFEVRLPARLLPA
jgi:signal transduction histidine kinase